MIEEVLAPLPQRHAPDRKTAARIHHFERGLELLLGITLGLAPGEAHAFTASIPVVTAPFVPGFAVL
jgi:hypothetical protein